MAFRFTLADARASGQLKAVAGVPSSSAQFVDLLNECQSRLAKRGDFFGTVQHMRLVFQGNVIAWPREVSKLISVRGLHGNLRHQNQWGVHLGAWSGSIEGFGDMICEDLDPSPVTNEIFGGGNGVRLRYYVTHPSDYGKKITIFGRKAGYAPLQTTISGSTTDGLTLTAVTPYGGTNDRVTFIDSIKREATIAPAFLYQYDPDTDTLIDLAMFDAGDTAPMFRRSILKGVPPPTESSDPTQPVFNQVEALVKLNFIPVKRETDFLLIDDFDALKFMFQAIKAEEANDTATAEGLIVKAIRELNFTDREKIPDYTTPVSLDYGAGNIRSPL